MNEYKSYSEYSSNAPTLIVLPSDDDTEVQPSMQSSEEGDQSIASRTRYHLARRSTTTTALHTESLPSQQNLQTPITNTDPTDPLPTPQPTNDHSLIDLQDRKRALLKHSGRCFENHTGIVLPSMSEASDEEVDYGSFGIVANLNTDSDHEWSTSGNDSQD